MKAIFSETLKKLIQDDPNLLSKLLEAERETYETFTTRKSKTKVKVNRIIETGGYRVGIVPEA